MQRYQYTLIIFFLLLSHSLFAQLGTIKGSISALGDPVAYASIGIVNSRFGTKTTTQGKYILSKIPYGQYKIVASFVGF